MSARGAARRPGAVTSGVVLLIVSGLLSNIVVARDPGLGPLPTALWFACFWFAVRAGRGRRIARTAACVLAGVLALLAVPYAWALPASSPDRPGYAVIHLAACALAGVAAYQLHRPPAPAYFDARSPRP